MVSAQPRRLAFALIALTASLPSSVWAQSNSVLTLLPTDGRLLQIGQESTGALSTADYVSESDNLLEAWELEGRAGQSVTVDLMSDAFDARLYMTGPGMAETLSDDDSGGGCNARITTTLLENGTYRVVASSLGQRSTGTYTLRVGDRPGDTPAYGCGDTDPVVLDGLPTEGRAIGLGQAQFGNLGPSSPTVQDGRPAQAWELNGSPGDRISIILESEAFDTYLYVSGPGLDGVLEDDDGAGELNSMIEVTLPTAGPYRVVAAAYSATASGLYTLRVTEAPDPNELPIDGTITLGETLSRTFPTSGPSLLDGRRGEVIAFEGTAGQRIVVDEEADFDTYLYLVGPGLVEPMSDDDGGDGLDSRITVTLPETGTYRIIASALSDSASGDYTLRVSAP